MRTALILLASMFVIACEQEQQSPEAVPVVKRPIPKPKAVEKKVLFKWNAPPLYSSCGGAAKWTLMDWEDFEVPEPRKPVSIEDALDQAQTIQDARNKRLDTVRAANSPSLCRGDDRHYY